MPQGNQKKLCIGLPIYGPVDPHFFLSALAMNLDAAHQSIVVKTYLGDSAVSRARNTVTNFFLTETDCTHLLFIDSDLVFSMDHINRILSHDEPLVGGCYFKKNQNAAGIVCNALDRPAPLREDALQEVKYIGTGFMCIARTVFESMIEHFGNDMWYKRDHDGKIEYDFWRCAPYNYKDGTRRYLTEDWWFCQKWLDLGGRVWMDTRIILYHSGLALYPLEHQAKHLIIHDPIKILGADTPGTAEPTPLPSTAGPAPILLQQTQSTAA